MSVEKRKIKSYSIRPSLHTALKQIALNEDKSISDVLEQAINNLLKKKK